MMKSFIAAIIVSLGLGQATLAANISEYFNDYGSTQVDIASLNGGTGWSGAWAGSANPKMTPGAQLSYSALGYSNAGNESDAADGVITSTGSAGNVVHRPLSGLTGTIWVSALARTTSTSGDMLLWLDKTEAGTSGTGRDFVGLRGSTGTSGAANPEAVSAYDGTDDVSSTIDFVPNQTHLFLVKVEVDVSGTFDTFQFWVNPDLSGGEAGLGTPIYSKLGVDAYGTTFDGIGFSSTGSVMMDAFRISNDANSFQFVTTGAVPEPATFALLGLGLAGLGTFLSRQRRRRA